MYTLHSASLPPFDAELSRRAAARYAVLAAVKEQRLQQHHASRRRRPVPTQTRVLATDTAAVTPRC